MGLVILVDRVNAIYPSSPLPFFKALYSYLYSTKTVFAPFSKTEKADIGKQLTRKPFAAVGIQNLILELRSLPALGIILEIVNV